MIKNFILTLATLSSFVFTTEITAFPRHKTQNKNNVHLKESTEETKLTSTDNNEYAAFVENTPSDFSFRIKNLESLESITHFPIENIEISHSLRDFINNRYNSSDIVLDNFEADFKWTRVNANSFSDKSILTGEIHGVSTMQVSLFKDTTNDTPHNVRFTLFYEIENGKIAFYLKDLSLRLSHKKRTPNNPNHPNRKRWRRSAVESNAEDTNDSLPKSNPKQDRRGRCVPLLKFENKEVLIFEKEL